MSGHGNDLLGALQELQDDLRLIAAEAFSRTPEDLEGRFQRQLELVRECEHMLHAATAVGVDAAERVLVAAAARDLRRSVRVLSLIIRSAQRSNSALLNALSGGCDTTRVQVSG